VLFVYYLPALHAFIFFGIKKLFAFILEVLGGMSAFGEIISAPMPAVEVGTRFAIAFLNVTD
jgi:hypothetical protein